MTFHPGSAFARHVAGLLGAVGLVGTCVAAPSMEPATFHESINDARFTPPDDPNAFYTPGVLEFDYAESNGFYSARAATSGGVPALSDVQIAGQGIGPLAVSADATWSVAISGPAGVTRDVPVLLHLVGEAQRTGNANAIAESTVRVDNQLGQILVSNLTRVNDQNGLTQRGYDVTVSRLVNVGPDGRALFFRASATVAPTGSGAYEGQALADPEVRIDPTWPFAGEYALTYSEGIVVPEPGVAIGAVAAATMLMRRRR